MVRAERQQQNDRQGHPQEHQQDRAHGVCLTVKVDSQYTERIDVVAVPVSLRL